MPSPRAARLTWRRSSRRFSDRAAALPWKGSTSGERTCRPSSARGPRRPARRRRQIAAEVARGELGTPKAERLDEEDLVARREAPHQVVLVDRQLGRPVGGADADDLAPLELHSGSNRSRIRSNSSIAVS